MEFFKHKGAMILLILSLIILVAAVWYLLFGLPQTPPPGGILVTRILEMAGI